MSNCSMAARKGGHLRLTKDVALAKVYSRNKEIEGLKELFKKSKRDSMVSRTVAHQFSTVKVRKSPINIHSPSI